MARRMEAVADIRPSDGRRGQRRHSFLLRLDGQDPADAVVSAVARYRDASVDGGALVGARVLRGGDVAGARPRARVLRPRVLAVCAVVLLAGAALLALGGGRGSAVRATSREVPPAAANLLTNASFEVAGPKSKGLARGLTGWGAQRAALVDAPVHSGERAQQVQVAAGQTGGLWFDVDAVAGRAYVQSAWIDVQQVDPGSRVEMILEWYGTAANLLGYQEVPITTADATFVERHQTATAPAGTVRVRFLVNFTAGGSAVIDDADLRTPPVSGR